MLAIALCEEGVTGSLGVFSTSGSTNSMDIILNLSREVKVDDKLDVIDIEPTRGDVRSNEDWNSSTSETLEDMVALALALVSVNRSCFPSKSFHLVGELVCATFCFCEDDGFGLAFFH